MNSFMARSRKKNTIIPAAGWAVYLRTSDEEAQNPEASQARQRYLIQKSVLDRLDLPVIDEYIDLLTGRTPRRTGCQRMLEDARMGRFSHVIVERADRFGRNDTEALPAIDELDEFGVSVRFANQPDLDPMSPDDRVIVALSFTLARRESMMTSLRIKGAVDAKRENGSCIGRAPDGYISVEDEQPHRKTYARRTHHIEPDPDRAPIWRLAWDLLLEDRLTLAEIAEELHTRGYRYRSGRPFVEVKANGKRKANYNSMAYSFHNWAYAGWIVEVADKLGRLRPDERTEIERALKQIDEEEARVLRLYAATMVTEENWRNLWAEWQDKRHKLRASLDLLDQKCESYIDDLDQALTIIAKFSKSRKLQEA
jgi:DNA invertase Pin-like site-specific DNA recombinase